MVGKTISHYKILEKLGEGGMGVVYKAEDTKLERTVALKFLSLTSIGDEEKKRFKREAKAAASLNHPNIATIHAIDEVDEQIFIAMEYIDGQSLQEMVGMNGGKPMPIDKAIDYATQTAAGLQAAHKKGITHRDIKSANIMITEDDQVKIMDFGLAKLANRSKLTQLGTTLGTAAYMSPEQSRGEEADHRADIWSLGVVLYEMISGQLPFPGDYEQAVIYSIQNEEPEPLTALRTGVPIALDGIIAKALAKDPATRYQNVEELPADLRAIESESLIRSRILAPTAATGIETKIRKRNLILPWVIAGIFLVCLLGLTFLYFSTSRIERQTIRASLLPPKGTTFTSDVPGFRGGHLAMSPDGRKLAFVATDSLRGRSLWIRDLSVLSARELPGTEDAAYPFWSPDSRFIGFWAGGKLRKIDTSGGPSVTLCDSPLGRGGTWNQTDLILFFHGRDRAIYQVPATGGSPTAVTKIDSTRHQGHLWPVFLPDGKHFFYLAVVESNTASDRATANEVLIGSLTAKSGSKSSGDRLLFPTATNIGYARGYVIYGRENSLVAQPFDEQKLDIVGEAVTISDQVQIISVFAKADFSVSENGTLAYRQSTGVGTHLIWFDRKGRKLGTVGQSAQMEDPELSLDGKKVAISRLNSQTGDYDIWIHELSRGTFSRFTVGASTDDDPVWAPDGKSLVFASDGKIFQKSTMGGRSAELLLESIVDAIPLDWSRDGQFILYEDSTPETGRDLWVLPMSGKDKPFPFLQSSFRETHGQFSPDGRWIAYCSNETNRFEIYVQSFPVKREKLLISTGGGVMPRWTRNGKELIYIDLDGKLMATEMITISPGLEPGKPKVLFDTGLHFLNNPNHSYVVTEDGSRFLLDRPLQQLGAHINLVVNLTEELQKK